MTVPRPALQVKEYRQQGANPLVLFSGDCYNPSLMSTITLGKQMVPVLNEIGVNVSCVGVSGGARPRRSHGPGESLPWPAACIHTGWHVPHPLCCVARAGF